MVKEPVLEEFIGGENGVRAFVVAGVSSGSGKTTIVGAIPPNW